MAISPVNMGAGIIPADLQLTPDFWLREFAVSAEHPELANTMWFSELEATKLFYLCTFILQPLRDLIGYAIEILSGKRTPELNVLVGGSKTSQHVLCEAADFVVKPSVVGQAFLPVNSTGWKPVPPIDNPAPTLKNLQDIFEFMARTWAHLYHQLIIYYTDNGKPRFVHVSLPPSPMVQMVTQGGTPPSLPVNSTGSKVARHPVPPKPAKRKGAFYHHKGQYLKVEIK